MFWAKAHRTYPNVGADDPDVMLFQKLSSNFQEDSYRGLVGMIQDAGHRWIARRTSEHKGRILEIGFGAGRHTLFYLGDLDDYFVSDYSPVHLDSEIWSSFRCRGHSSICDARNLPFSDNTFKTVISIYNLEHISNLPSVFTEVHRVLEQSGRFLIALPCEGGLAFNLGRELTTRRFFRRKYGINYDKVIAYEHVWCFKDVMMHLRRSQLFTFRKTRFYPMFLPFVCLNLIACVECVRS